MFDSVLIANRGEIAVRITRTLRGLGIRSIAVFSDADRAARHVLDADAAVHIGPAAAVDSYLDVDRIIDAALRSGAQALHPGYGFLSENVALARACADAGIVFVGPPVAAMEAMGDKISAKQTVAANGVRVVPGVSGAGLDNDELIEAAASEIGVPALIKPSAGGGGKGMRLVTDAAHFADEIAAARREARTAFGDDTLLIERYVERPRHIEVQVLADAHGNVVHLGERECSLQRRHQKVIEEAPSPFLADDQRVALGEQAVAAARACGYVNAGTVEFIVSGASADDAYFLEMNTRLQVEHPVTEMVWGIDLVEHQLRIAAGEPLPFGQADLAPRGHAFEARVYAEDTDRGFLPTGGTVVALHEPVDLPHVRVDSSLQTGTVVGSDYDPMLAKVIAWGPDRDSARRRTDAALADTVVLGVTTNVSLLRDLLRDTDVAAGVMDTGLVERIVASHAPPTTRTPDMVHVAAAFVLLDESARPGPWGRRDGWRIGPPATIEQRLVDADGIESTVGVLCTRDGHGWEATVDGRAVPVRLERTGDRVRIECAAGVTDLVVAVGDDDGVWLGSGGAAWCLRPSAVRRRRHAGSGADGLALVSPMPGTVVAVMVAAGDTVVEGQPIVVVEAMKMEHTLRAATGSTVREIPVAVGDRVELRQTLAQFDPTPDAAITTTPAVPETEPAS